MSRPEEPSRARFKGRHFGREIIMLCVRWYITDKLSYRDLAAMMAERPGDLAHRTSMRWVQRHVLHFVKQGWRYSGRRDGPAGVSMKRRASAKARDLPLIAGSTRKGKPSTFSVVSGARVQQPSGFCRKRSKSEASRSRSRGTAMRRGMKGAQSDRKRTYCRQISARGRTVM
jgi:hypothetical protein